MNAKESILEEFRTLNITKCVIYYSGGGDSGQIDDINVHLKDVDDVCNLQEAEAKAPKTDQMILMKIRDRLLGENTSSLEERVDSLVYQCLEDVQATDWVNNDGGGGTMIIYVEDGEHDDGSVTAGTIKINHYYNITEQETENYEC